MELTFLEDILKFVMGTCFWKRSTKAKFRDVKALLGCLGKYSCSYMDGVATAGPG